MLAKRMGLQVAGRRHQLRKGSRKLSGLGHRAKSRGCPASRWACRAGWSSTANRKVPPRW